MKKEHLNQLRAAYNEGSRGIWSSIGQDHKWGVLCNDEVVADGMQMNNAYLVDVMHEHFIPLVDENDILQTEKAELLAKEENYLLRIDVLERQVTHYKNAWNAAIIAGQELANEIV